MLTSESSSEVVKLTALWNVFLLKMLLVLRRDLGLVTLKFWKSWISRAQAVCLNWHVLPG